MTIAAPTKKFFAESVSTIPGWLTDSAALMTAHLAAAQTAHGTRGSVFEIGVYAGRYLALLHHLFPDAPVTGVDLFRAVSTKDVRAHFQRVFGDTERLKLVQQDSGKLDAAGVLDVLQQVRPRFISVDGDHGAKAVAHDLALAADLLGEGGIIAVDDYLNPVAIGVHEGVCRYFLLENRDRLRPFCYCGNKLFVGHASDQKRWRKAAYGFAEAEPDLDSSRQFAQRAKQGECFVQQTLHDAPVVIH